MKHKHYDCIVAGAEGKQIQYKAIRRVEDWQDISFTLIDWGDSSLEYRIKPEPKPDFFRHITVEATIFHGEPFVQVFKSGEYLFPNLRLTFDGETGKLKSAEVL
jgi:hypothetical protein